MVAVFALASGYWRKRGDLQRCQCVSLPTLPVPDPIKWFDFRSYGRPWRRIVFSYPEFADYRDQSSVFEGLAAEDMAQAAISTKTERCHLGPAGQRQFF